MSLPKGDKIISNTLILFGKYVVLETLGKGAFSTVYLAKHQSLESLCAIKVVPKQLTQGLIILSEAQLLKSFHHKGIPQIYDFEEDSESYYLIEEYVEGQRLDEYLLQESKVSISSFFNIITQIFDIFIYLHEQLPSPVIYQDLKPEHIYLCGDTVKLIDFGVSTFLSNLGTNPQTFGNTLFCPPELTQGASPSISSDIYCLGCLLQYMADYLRDPLPKEFQKFIAKSTMEDPSLRFETVAQMKASIENMNQHFGKTHLSRHIAVVGCHSGCGATHLAISLTCALNANGYKAYYHERNLTNSLRNMKAFSNMSEQKGCLHTTHFMGYPLYGPGVSLTMEENACHIYDFGHEENPKDLSTCDSILYICDNALWHRKAALEKYPSLLPFVDRLQIIGNRCSKSTALYFSKAFSLPVVLYPEDLDVLQHNETKQKLLLQTIQMKGRRTSFFKRKKKVIGLSKS